MNSRDGTVFNYITITDKTIPKYKWCRKSMNHELCWLKNERELKYEQNNDLLTAKNIRYLKLNMPNFLRKSIWVSIG
jgi:hypothetical protein